MNEQLLQSLIDKINEIRPDILAADVARLVKDQMFARRLSSLQTIAWLNRLPPRELIPLLGRLIKHDQANERLAARQRYARGELLTGQDVRELLK